VAVSTQLIINSRAISDRFEVLLLDTADRRDGKNIGRFDFVNLRLAMLHAIRCQTNLRQNKPDIVYMPVSQGMYGYLRDALFLYLSHHYHRRVVVHLRGGNYHNFYLQSPFWLKWIIRNSLSKVRRAVVLGERFKDLLEGILPSDRVVVIPNGSDDFLAGRPAPDRIHRESTQILFLGNLITDKGTHVVLRAARKVCDQFKEARFVLVGEWTSKRERTETLHLMRELELEARVDFRGVAVGREKEDLLLSSDIMVFPSYFPLEGHPRVILEGMAAGLPIVATDHAAIPETIVDGETGFIVSKRDDAAVADRICQLLRDEALRRRMGQAARERFLTHYTAEVSNALLAKVFADVLEEPPSNSRKGAANIQSHQGRGSYSDPTPLFDKLSRTWSARYGVHKVFRKRRELLAQFAAKFFTGSDTVLDVGCGTGDIAFRLASMTFCLTGLDKSYQMLLNASGPASTSELDFNGFVNADALALPFANRTFNAVICSSVLEYVDEENVALRELRRVLTPGGIALISVPNRQSVWRMFERVLIPHLMRLGRIKRILGGRRVDYLLFQKRQHDVHSFRRLALASGMAIIEYQSFGANSLVESFLPGYLIELEKQNWFGTMLLIVLRRIE
jgi:glycosyltransferase involved in cell wall biosynthesis/ubiquinone/menaquinone biosynthesis C-methylase UbiE